MQVKSTDTYGVEKPVCMNLCQSLAVLDSQYSHHLKQNQLRPCLVNGVLVCIKVNHTSADILKRFSTAIRSHAYTARIRVVKN